MKARSQRTHQMGKSNRQKSIQAQKPLTIYQKSLNKSSILYDRNKLSSTKSKYIQTNNTSNLADHLTQSASVSFSSPNQNKYKINPLSGTNFQLQSSRFDKMNIKQYRYMQNKKIKDRIKIKDFSDRINENIKQIKKRYQGKQIDTHKIYLLKQAILKNNHQRENFDQYFNRFLEENNQAQLSSNNHTQNNIMTKQSQKNNKFITNQGIKKFIKSFGYDLNNDEISLFLKLNKQGSNKRQASIQQSSTSNIAQQIKLNMKDFIKLCTKDSIYYKTIDLTSQNHRKISHKIFKPNNFQILRNKFNKLKQAFKIYSTRNESISYNQFIYTMKKLDITDLIMSKHQRDQLFYKFSDQSGVFNSQKLLSAIASQFHEQKQERIQKTGFQNNLKYIEQQTSQCLKQKQNKFNLKKSSFVQYQSHLSNARVLLSKIRFIQNQKRSSNSSSNNKKVQFQQQTQASLFVIDQDKAVINRFQLRKKIQDHLLNHGYSFGNQKYQSLMGYIDFDNNGNITLKQLEKFLINQSNKQAEARIQRQTRNLPPIATNKIDINIDDSNVICDPKQAVRTLKSLKSQTLNPEVSSMFTLLDKDKDGYISKSQMQKKVKNIMPRQDPEKIHNMLNYLYENKPYLNRDQFVKKYVDDNIDFTTHKSKSVSEWGNMRRSCIQQFKKAYYQRPTKYSAWPEHLFQHNMSLIQPQKNTGVYISQTQRFNSTQKHNFGLEQKLQRKRIQNAKISKLSALYQQQQSKQIQKQKLEIKKQEDKNFNVRLVRQQYNQNLILNQ